MRTSTTTRTERDRRIARVLVVLFLTALLSGCLGTPSARTLLVTERLTFDADAPREASAWLASLSRERTCGEEGFDPSVPLVTLAAGAERPLAILVRQRAFDAVGAHGEPDPGAGLANVVGMGRVQGPEDLEPFVTILQEARGGTFVEGVITTSPDGWKTEVNSSSDGWNTKVNYDRKGLSFMGERMEEGVSLTRSWRETVTFQNATFGVMHEQVASYLGRVRYALAESCAP